MATLEGVRLLDRDGERDRADLRPTTLENYIKICKRYEKHCVLELKTAFTDEEIARIVGIIEGYEYLDRVTFISFCYENLLKLRAIRPNQSAQLLFSSVTDEILDRLAAARIDVDVHHVALTAEVVERMHALGLVVNCYTVDDPARAEELVGMGVDLITTNILE